MSNLSSSRKRSYKRGHEHESESLEPASKRHCSRLEILSPAPASIQQAPSPLTPPATTASPKYNGPFSGQPRTPSEAKRKGYNPSSRARSESKESRRAFDDRKRDQAATKQRWQSPVQSQSQALGSQSAEHLRSWFLNDWLEKLPRSRAIEEEIEGSGIVSSIELPPESEAGWEQMSRQDVESTQSPGSVISERTKTSNPMYRGALKMNGVVIDNLGTDIPRDVEELVTKHIRKARASPPLGDDKLASIKRKIQEVWDSPEPTVSDIITAPLFDFADPALAVGRDTLWSPKPLPRSSDYPLVTPKTDHHVGFQPTLRSEWTRLELGVADNPQVRPYSQPTRENLFPSFLLEVKSEATGGTLYGAEGQLATAGFHRVRSLIWLLDQIDSTRTRSSCDAIVFSAALCQREVVAHVHYYNPENETFYMSYIDHFYFAKDIQGCHNYTKNVAEWLLQVQQPIVRDALRALHPITQLWKRARSASFVGDAEASSSRSQDSRSAKKQRLAK